MSREEIQGLLAVAPSHRRLLYEVALLSGLRGNELRQLSLDHLDIAACGLHLEARWTKSRKQQFLPLPRMLAERLRDNTAAALSRYLLTYKGAVPPIIPATPLLYVPRDLAPTLDKDLRAAGIPKYTKAGKLDFHPLRVTYINLLIASGVNPKEAQTLARHATAAWTIGLYGRATDQRLAQAIEQIPQYVLCMASAGEEQTQAIEISEESTMPKGGFEPPLADDVTGHACDTCITQPIQNPTFGKTASARSAQNNTISERPPDIGVHGEYGICMGDLSDDLRTVIDAWERLPQAVQAGIVAIVNAAQQ